MPKRSFNPHKVDPFVASPFRVERKTKRRGSKNALRTNKKTTPEKVIKINKRSPHTKKVLERLDAARREVAIEIIDYLKKHSFSDIRTMSEGLFSVRISQRRIRVPYYNSYYKKTLSRPVTVSEIEKITKMLLEKK